MLLVVGLFTVPRLIRAVVRLDRPETTVVASVDSRSALPAGGGVRLLGGTRGVSGGGAGRGIGRGEDRRALVQPVRDIFAAIFFVSVGMLIDPAEIVAHWPVVLVFLIVVVVGNIVCRDDRCVSHRPERADVGEDRHEPGADRRVFVHHRRRRHRDRRDGRGAVFDCRRRVGNHDAADAVVDSRGRPDGRVGRSKLPRSLQTFAALYASWLEQLRARPADGQTGRVRRAIRWLIVDAVVVAAIIIGASVEMDRIAAIARVAFESFRRAQPVAGGRRRRGALGAVLDRPGPRGAVSGLRAGHAGVSRRLEARNSSTWRPRRAGCSSSRCNWRSCFVGMPLVAITQPFLPPFRGAAVLLFVLLLLAVAFWRGAANLQGHTRAAAQALADALARQTRTGRAEGGSHDLAEANRILAGLGSPVPVELQRDNPAVGKTLAEIKLRGLTGATVLAIQRGDESVLVPSGHERLQAGDVLAIAGTHEAVEAARSYWRRMTRRNRSDSV